MITTEQLTDLAAAEPIPEIALVVLGEDCEAANWAGRINATWDGAVAKFLEAGRHLIAAKAKLPHGEWLRMFAGHPRAVKIPLRFGVATAQHLMAIARHPVLGNTERCSAFPPSWGTLYQLSRLDEIHLETYLLEGRIHPEMTRRDAEALLPAKAAQREKGASIKAILVGKMGWAPLDPIAQPSPAALAALVVQWRQIEADLERNVAEWKALRVKLWNVTRLINIALYGKTDRPWTEPDGREVLP